MEIADWKRLAPQLDSSKWQEKKEVLVDNIWRTAMRAPGVKPGAAHISLSK